MIVRSLLQTIRRVTSKPVTSQPPQVPLKPSYSSIEVATPKETKSDSPLLEDIPDLGLEQMPSLLQDDARPADPASKLTPPENYLSDYVDNLGKGETPPDGTLLAGPGYIDEDDAFDNPYYTSPVPDLDDDSDFPDLGDLGLAQATESNFQKLLNQPGQQETALASALPLMPPALQAAGAKDDSDLCKRFRPSPGNRSKLPKAVKSARSARPETAFAPALPFIPPCG